MQVPRKKTRSLVDFGGALGASGLITRFRSSPKAFRVIPFAGFFAAGSGASGGRDVMPPPYHAQLFENAM
jgi:hypothetical protein